MNTFTNPESKVYRLGGKLVDLFFLNILFLLTSLPVITLGASTTAMFTVTMKMVDDSQGPLVKSYFKAFKDNFWRGTFTGVVLLAVGAVLYVGLHVLRMFPILSFIIVGIALLIAVINYAVMLLFVFPYNARYSDGFWHSFKVCWQMALLNLKPTIGLVLGLAGVLAVITLDSFYAILASYFLIVIGFSSVALLISSIVKPVFAQYEHK
ncbi:YesL family protein [Schleiferilactobacillus shenzhenensis]|nr:DUF624 domain-containing protein [Schleiferilactobacillus shenzhenensis]